MGVAGSGKTTIGQSMAAKLGQVGKIADYRTTITMSLFS